MGSASRQALAAAREALAGPLDSAVGAELREAAAKMAGAPALVAALGDASATADAKTALVADLFGGFTEQAQRVLVEAVTETWSTPEELVAGIEELGFRADAAGTEQLSDELLNAASVIDSDHELELTLGDKLGDPSQKRALGAKIFGGRLSGAALSIVSHTVAIARDRPLRHTLREARRG